jgi:hypothetical protein
MKLREALQSIEPQQAIEIAKAEATALGIQWTDGINHVFQACLDNPDLIPTNISTKDAAEGAIKRWVQKYKAAYESRISVHRSNQPNTIADPIVDVIIQGRLTHLSKNDLIKIKFAHRLSMSAENILGLLLEEFLALHLGPKGWHCAWGETIRSVDFCSSRGKLLQIKNRSNSENSSSSRVREGTSILKWYRVDATSGSYLWEDLNARFKVSCSEDSFREFVHDALAHNPDALAIEPTNPWLTKSE